MVNGDHRVEHNIVRIRFINLNFDNYSRNDIVQYNTLYISSTNK